LLVASFLCIQQILVLLVKMRKSRKSL
jgi:hypothetical protein